LVAIANQLSELQAQLQALVSPTIPISPDTDMSPVNQGLMVAPPPDSATRSLVFTLSAPPGPTQVRVTIDHAEVVIFNNWSTPSKPRANGAWISVLIELIGSAPASVTINISNVFPAALTSTIPAGKTHWADHTVIQAKW
jgi:hypothetical protein